MPKFNWPIIGHQKIINYLQTVIKNKTLSHGYLFYGPDGLGKTEIADYFIKTIYCASRASLPCGSCIHCRQISKGIHPDVIYLTKAPDKKNISVEQVRETRSKIYRGTFLNSHKIILISEAETLSLAASNALLKILEEPTQKTIFIFLAPSLQNIPATILSRLQLIKFMPVPTEQLEAYLVQQGLGKAEAYELAHLAGGFPGRILPLFNHPKLLTEYKNKFLELLESISDDLSSRFALVEKLAAQTNSQSAKIESRQFLQDLNSLLHDSLMLKNMCFDKIVHQPLKKQLSSLANKYTSSQLAKLLTKIKITQKYLEQNINLRLALENLMLEF
jgi:DNA polymerase-3 subunit delta'